jgi:hypothetical protein
MNARFLAIAVALASVSAPAFALADTPASSSVQDSTFDGGAQAQPNRYNMARGAPADEYFGSQHLSILGIRNKIRDVSLKMDVGRPPASNDVMHDMRIVEDAIRDWERHYPADSWLPRIVYALHHVYTSLGSADSTQHAVDVAAWLVAKYPGSREATALRGGAEQSTVADQ